MLVAQRSTELDSVQRSGEFGALSPKWDLFIEHLPARLRDLYGGEGSRKIVRPRSWGSLQGNRISQTHRDNTHRNSCAPQDLHKFKPDQVPAKTEKRK